LKVVDLFRLICKDNLEVNLVLLIPALECVMHISHYVADSCWSRPDVQSTWSNIEVVARCRNLESSRCIWPRMAVVVRTWHELC